jgi:hypothetical protein
MDCSWCSSWSESILRATINSESEPQLFDADAVALQLPGLLAEDESMASRRCEVFNQGMPPGSAEWLKNACAELGGPLEDSKLKYGLENKFSIPVEIGVSDWLTVAAIRENGLETGYCSARLPT